MAVMTNWPLCILLMSPQIEVFSDVEDVEAVAFDAGR